MSANRKASDSRNRESQQSETLRHFRQGSGYVSVDVERLHCVPSVVLRIQRALRRLPVPNTSQTFQSPPPRPIYHGRRGLLYCLRIGKLAIYTIKKLDVKPILKWAGGKSQLLPELLSRIPFGFDRYVEPFVGGAALFFALQPEHAIISDSNPELINLYQCVANDVEDVITRLKRYVNTEEAFYRVRAQDWRTLPAPEAAARMIYLNRTCFNGLYRVNRKGEFNVPYGRYSNPRICDQDNLRNASIVLKRAEILCMDYLTVLDERTQPGDFVFLDPPYLPIGEWGDFKRYTKEQFYEEDHRQLADAIHRLNARNVWAVLTNSNHPLVHELYADFPMVIVPTKRNISCRGQNRTGKDAIVDCKPTSKSALEKYLTVKLPPQMLKFPATRFMGSKRKLLGQIWKAASRFEFESILDLFSGSGVVGYMFKTFGKRVFSNDYMAMSATFCKAMVENNNVVLTDEEANALLEPSDNIDDFVSRTFRSLYFSDEDNSLIDILRSNISKLRNPYKKAIALTALIRACTKKRPRGLFTYIGLRYDDGRKDLKMSMREQFLAGVKAVNAAVFNNHKKNHSRCGDAMSVPADGIDAVYIDPPYFTPQSDNEYVRRYHFIEGLARDWQGVEIQENTLTKKFKSYPTPFSTLIGAAEAFNHIFSRFRNSLLIVSYSSNSLPTKDEMIDLMAKYKRHVEVVPIDYRYNFGNRSDGKVKRNVVKGYIFIGY